MNQGEMLVVVGEAHDYYAVTPPKDVKTYVYRNYVLDGAVTGEHVNVRLGPELEAPIVGQLNTGDHVVGEVAEENARWMAIEPPEGCCLFIAKDYLENVGAPDLIETHERRLNEVNHLLKSAYLTSQSELHKPYPEVDFARVKKCFDRVTEEYGDLPEFAQKAEHVLELAQDLFLQKKIAYLEAKAEESASNWEGRSVELNDQLRAYQERLKSFEEELALAEVVEEVPAVEEVIEVAQELVDEFALNIEPITDKMRQWEPVEESLYHLWAMDYGDMTMEEFYQEQLADSTVIEGILEAYDRPVQNRPGDFVLRVDNRPVAFLYSTQVNLEDKVGQHVHVKVVERPNNHFAFPAYFVMSVL